MWLHSGEIEKELTNSATVFCQDYVVFDADDKAVFLPEVLKEFLADFQCSEIDLVKKHLSTFCVGDQADQYARLISSVSSEEDFSVHWVSKEWELNEWVQDSQ